MSERRRTRIMFRKACTNTFRVLEELISAILNTGTLLFEETRQGKTMVKREGVRKY